MSLEQQLAEAIIIAFDQLGGDPQAAMKEALYHRTTRDWVGQEAGKTALSGGAEMLIPGLHLLTIPAGITFLLSKMAAVNWGVGALYRAYVVETSEFSDLRNILAVWANGNYVNWQELDHRPISLAAAQYALTPAGYQHLTQLVNRPNESLSDADYKTYLLLAKFGADFAGDERAQAQLRLQVNRQAVEDALATAAQRPSDDSMAFSKPLSRRMSVYLAGRLAAQLAARLPARFLAGWIPVVGALVNALSNAATLQSMADAAAAYYQQALKLEDIAEVR